MTTDGIAIATAFDEMVLETVAVVAAQVATETATTGTEILTVAEIAR